MSSPNPARHSSGSQRFQHSSHPGFSSTDQNEMQIEASNGTCSNAPLQSYHSAVLNRYNVESSIHSPQGESCGDYGQVVTNSDFQSSRYKKTTMNNGGDTQDRGFTPAHTGSAFREVEPMVEEITVQQFCHDENPNEEEQREEIVLELPAEPYQTETIVTGVVTIEQNGALINMEMYEMDQEIDANDENLMAHCTNQDADELLCPDERSKAQEVHAIVEENLEGQHEEDVTYEQETTVVETIVYEEVQTRNEEVGDQSVPIQAEHSQSNNIPDDQAIEQGQEATSSHVEQVEEHEAVEEFPSSPGSHIEEVSQHTVRHEETLETSSQQNFDAETEGRNMMNYQVEQNIIVQKPLSVAKSTQGQENQTVEAQRSPSVAKSSHEGQNEQPEFEHSEPQEYESNNNTEINVERIQKNDNMHQEEQISDVHRPPSATKSSHEQANEQPVEQIESFQHNDSHNIEVPIGSEQDNTVICQDIQATDVQRHSSAANSNHEQVNEQPVEQIEPFEHNDSHNIEEPIESIQEEAVTHQVNQVNDVQRLPSATKSNHDQVQEQAEEQNEPLRHETHIKTEMNIEVEQTVSIERPSSATKSNHEQLQEELQQQNETLRDEAHLNVEMSIEVEQEIIATHQVEQVIEAQKSPSVARSVQGQLNEEFVQQNEASEHENKHSMELHAELEQENLTVHQTGQNTDVQRPPSATKSNQQQLQEQFEEQNQLLTHETHLNIEMNIEVEQTTVTVDQVEQATNVQKPPSASKSNCEQLNQELFEQNESFLEESNNIVIRIEAVEEDTTIYQVEDQTVDAQKPYSVAKSNQEQLQEETINNQASKNQVDQVETVLQEYNEEPNTMEQPQEHHAEAQISNNQANEAELVAQECNAQPNTMEQPQEQLANTQGSNNQAIEAEEHVECNDLPDTIEQPQEQLINTQVSNNQAIEAETVAQECNNEESSIVQQPQECHAEAQISNNQANETEPVAQESNAEPNTMEQPQEQLANTQDSNNQAIEAEEHVECNDRPDTMGHPQEQLTNTQVSNNQAIEAEEHVECNQQPNIMDQPPFDENGPLDSNMLYGERPTTTLCNPASSPVKVTHTQEDYSNSNVMIAEEAQPKYSPLRMVQIGDNGQNAMTVCNEVSHSDQAVHIAEEKHSPIRAVNTIEDTTGQQQEDAEANIREEAPIQASSEEIVQVVETNTNIEVVESKTITYEKITIVSTQTSPGRVLNATENDPSNERMMSLEEIHHEKVSITHVEGSSGEVNQMNDEVCQNEDDSIHVKVKVVTEPLPDVSAGGNEEKNEQDASLLGQVDENSFCAVEISFNNDNEAFNKAGDNRKGIKEDSAVKSIRSFLANTSTHKKEIVPPQIFTPQNPKANSMESDKIILRGCAFGFDPALNSQEGESLLPPEEGSKTLFKLQECLAELEDDQQGIVIVANQDRTPSRRPARFGKAQPEEETLAQHNDQPNESHEEPQIICRETYNKITVYTQEQEVTNNQTQRFETVETGHVAQHPAQDEHSEVDEPIRISELNMRADMHSNEQDFEETNIYITQREEEADDEFDLNQEEETHRSEETEGRSENARYNESLAENMAEKTDMQIEEQPYEEVKVVETKQITTRTIRQVKPPKHIQQQRDQKVNNQKVNNITPKAKPVEVRNTSVKPERGRMAAEKTKESVSKPQVTAVQKKTAQMNTLQVRNNSKAPTTKAQPEKTALPLKSGSINTEAKEKTPVRSLQKNLGTNTMASKSVSKITPQPANSKKAMGISGTSTTGKLLASDKLRKFSAVDKENTEQLNLLKPQELKKVKKTEAPAPEVIKAEKVQKVEKVQRAMSQSVKKEPNTMTIRTPYHMKQSTPVAGRAANVSRSPMDVSQEKSPIDADSASVPCQKPMRTSLQKGNKSCISCGGGFQPGDMSVMLTCLHRVHKDCKKSMEQRKKTSCPICNSNSSLIDFTKPEPVVKKPSVVKG